MLELEADLFEEETELKRHVYALGRICGQTVAAMRRQAKNLWFDSRHVSPFPQPKSGSVEPPSTPPAKYSPLESRDSSPVGPRFQTPVQQRQPVATPVSGNSSLQNMDVVNMMEQLSKTVTKEVTAGVAGVAEQFASSLASMQKSNSQDEDTHDKFHAISQSEFRDSRPTISDDDPNIEDYDMLFETMIETWSIGKRKPRPIDILHMYGKGFPHGSTRHRVYKNHVRIAMKARRINK